MTQIDTKEVNTLLVADALFSCRAYLEALAISEAIRTGDRDVTQPWLMRKVKIALQELGVKEDLLELPKLRTLKEILREKPELMS